jgi:hypothetical protein
MKREEQEFEFEFIVVETVTYRLWAKGATVENAAVFARGSRRYFVEVEDRSVYGDLAVGSGHPLPSGEPADGDLFGIADGFRRGMERAGNPLSDDDCQTRPSFFCSLPSAYCFPPSAYCLLFFMVLPNRVRRFPARSRRGGAKGNRPPRGRPTGPRGPRPAADLSGLPLAPPCGR